MSSWFGVQFEPRLFREVLEEALRRRGVVGIRLWTPKHGGMGVATDLIKGRDAEAARRRSEAFGAFLRIEAELRCQYHQPSRSVQCSACLEWFEDGVHVERPLGAAAASFELCEIRSWDDERQAPAPRGSLPHRWRPVRCDRCSEIWANDLDDLRARLRPQIEMVGVA